MGIDAACYNCGQWYQVSPYGAGFARKYKGLCGKCPPIDCNTTAKELRDKYAEATDLLQRIEDAINNLGGPGSRPRSGAVVSVGALEEDRRTVKKRIRVLEEQWSRLKRRCPDIGEIAPGVPDRRIPELPDPKSPEGRKMLSDDAMKYVHAANELDKSAKKFEKWSKIIFPGAPSVSFEIPETGVELGVQYDFSKAGEVAAAGLEIRAIDLRETAEALDRLRDDPPEPNYEEVPEPNIPEAGAPGPTAAEQLSHQAKQDGKSATAFIRAFTTSFERYQAAKAAGNEEADKKQSEAMLRFALLAKVARDRAAANWQHFDEHLRAIEEKVTELTGSAPIERPESEEESSFRVDKEIRAGLLKRGSEASWPSVGDDTSLQLMEDLARRLVQG
jgi:hypothetical protein